MVVQRPHWWSRYYTKQCQNGHEWGPGKIIVSWMLCDCPPALPSWLRLVRTCRPLSGTPSDTELVPQACRHTLAARGGGVAWQQVAAMFGQVKGLVPTGQSCPPPLWTLSLAACQRRRKGAGNTRFPRKALLGWQAPLPGLSTVTRVG